MPVGLSAITARTAESFAGGILGVFDRTRVTEAPIPNGARPWVWPVFGSIGAIVVSPLLSIASGEGALYNLWLAVMLAVLWGGQRLTRREVGLAVGDGTSYLVAFAYVAVIVGLVGLGAWAAHAIDLTNFSAATVSRRLALKFLVTFALTLITTVYTLFGAGEKVGQLGIADHGMWDPERGYAGLALALAAAALLWVWIKPATSRSVTN